MISFVSVHVPASCDIPCVGSILYIKKTSSALSQREGLFWIKMCSIFSQVFIKYWFLPFTYSYEVFPTLIQEVHSTVIVLQN